MQLEAPAASTEQAVQLEIADAQLMQLLKFELGTVEKSAEHLMHPFAEHCVQPVTEALQLMHDRPSSLGTVLKSAAHVLHS